MPLDVATSSSAVRIPRATTDRDDGPRRGDDDARADDANGGEKQ